MMPYNDRSMSPFGDIGVDRRIQSNAPIIWAGGRQRPVVSEGEQRSILGAAGLVGAGIFAAGAIPYKNKRVWDAYISAAKAVEVFSPGQMLTTLRVSEALSPLESITPGRGRTQWGAEYWKTPSRQKYLERLIGKDLFAKHKKDILSQGLALRGGKLQVGGFGAYKPTLLSRATVLRSRREIGRAEFFRNYARSIGAGEFTEPTNPLRLYKNRFGKQAALSGIDAAGLQFKSIRQKTPEFIPIGGKNILHAYSRYGYAGITELTNRLLRVAPTEIAELPIARDYWRKLQAKAEPFKGSKAFGLLGRVFPEVVPGAAHQTIGRYLTRRVLPAVALWKGFQLADYATGHAISGIGFGAYSQAKILKAKTMEATGLRDLAERQESIAPGSTSLLGLAAFPLKGAMLGFAAWPARGAYAALHKFTGQEGSAVVAAAQYFKGEAFETGFGLGKKLGLKLPKRTLASALRRTGALAGLAFALPFLPGAIAGTESSEELKAIYSGEKEVAVRKGRWWEFGRCLSIKSIVYKNYIESVLASDIEVGDEILTKSGDKKKVLSIIRRRLDLGEKVFEVRASLDRTKCEILLTEDHPLLTKEGWKKTEYITKDDWLAFPRPKITDKIKEFDGIKLTSELGFLVGHFIAEGNLMRKRGEVCGIELCASLDELQYLERDRAAINEVWGKHNDIKEKKGNGVLRLRPCKKELGQWFESLLYWSGDKLLPDNFLEFDKEFLIAVVEGYYAGDGSQDKGMDTLTGARFTLLKQFQTVLLALGIPVSILEHGSYSKQVDKHCNSWRLMWNSNDKPTIKFPQKRKNIHIEEEYVWSRVYKKELVEYNDEVVDFEIEDEHSFVGPGFILHNTPYEGGKIQYFRQHFIPAYQSRGKVKALYGSEFGKIKHDPILNPIGFMMDPYAWEKEHYYEFPFPITGAAFEDVPLIGPLLAGTVGKLIKPPKLMHTEEWMRQTPGLVNEYFGSEGANNSGGQSNTPMGPMRGELQSYGYGAKNSYGEASRYSVKRLPDPFGYNAAYELGEMPRGVPVDPYRLDQTIGDQMYRLTEAYGLSGFSMGSIKEKLTGSEEWHDQYERLEASTRATGIERAYWDLSVGGGFMSTELFRRLYPHRRRQIDLYNPIKNMMPEWLPGPGEPSPDFQHGFAYGKIPEGELRLPGRGLAALYPELEGLDPQDYPLIWRYKVLADVSPYSPQTKFYKQAVASLRKQGGLTEREEQIYQMIQEQQQEKKKSIKPFLDRHNFIGQDTTTREVTITKMITPGTFEIAELPGARISMAGLNVSQAALSRLALEEDNALTQEEAGMAANRKRMRAAEELKSLGVMAGSKVKIEISNDVLSQFTKTKSDKPEIKAVVRAKDININRMMLESGLAEKANAGVFEGQVGYSGFERAVGALWEAGIRTIDDPTEFLTPFAPYHKFLGTKTRTAVEEYAASEAYGTTNAFWNRPWDNFLRPMIDYAAYKVGFTDLPDHIIERNELEEYFDKLKYMKYTRLKNAALAQGNKEAADEYEKLRRRTSFGADPYGNPLNAMLALHKRDRPYFDAFAKASSEADRELIMKMLPEHEKGLIRARWDNALLSQLYAAKKIQGGLSEEQRNIMIDLQRERIAEGQDVSEDAMSRYEDYLDTVDESAAMDYADFQRQAKLEDYFKNRPMPRADWVGWHPMTDLEDIKLVVVRNEGKDIHDFNLWESREKTLPYKPFIDEDAIRQVSIQDSDMSTHDIQLALYDILASYGIEDVNITVDKFHSRDAKNLIDLDITRDSLQTGFDQAVAEGWI